MERRSWRQKRTPVPGPGKDAAGLTRRAIPGFLSPVVVALPRYPVWRQPDMAHSKQRSSGSVERPSLDNFPTDLSGARKEDLLEVSKRFGVDFIRLQFTDIMGINKNVEVPRSQFAKALDGEIMFDGSSIEGFVRIEESDMLLKPDLHTLRVLPYDDEGGRVARLLCDIFTPDEQPFAGCPRTTLKRQVARAKKLGFSMMAGCEAEFFLFEKSPDGSSTTA